MRILKRGLTNGSISMRIHVLCLSVTFQHYCYMRWLLEHYAYLTVFFKKCRGRGFDRNVHHCQWLKLYLPTRYLLMSLFWSDFFFCTGKKMLGRCKSVGSLNWHNITLGWYWAWVRWIRKKEERCKKSARVGAYMNSKLMFSAVSVRKWNKSLIQKQLFSWFTYYWM